MEKLEKVTLTVELSTRYRKGHNDHRPFFSQCILFVYDITTKTYETYFHLTDDCRFVSERTFKADDWKYHIYQFDTGTTAIKRVNRVTKAVEWLTGSTSETIDYLLDVYNASTEKPNMEDCLEVLSLI